MDTHIAAPSVAARRMTVAATLTVTLFGVAAVTREGGCFRQGTGAGRWPSEGALPTSGRPDPCAHDPSHDRSAGACAGPSSPVLAAPLACDAGAQRIGGMCPLIGFEASSCHRDAARSRMFDDDGGGFGEAASERER